MNQKNQRELIERTVYGLGPTYKQAKVKNTEGHTFVDSSVLGDIAVADVKAYMLSYKKTISVKSVERDEAYQGRGTDLIWEFWKKGEIRTKYIEVKGDRWAHSGNIFVELISNITKNTPGCFIYTKADYIFYYFPETRELNTIDMRKFHKWWTSIDKLRFRVAYGKTLIKKGSDEFYKSEGRLVSKETLMKEIDMVQYELSKPKDET